jgi:hypothetical protein
MLASKQTLGGVCFRDFRNIPGNLKIGIKITVFVTWELQIIPRKDLCPGNKFSHVLRLPIPI